MGSKDRMLKNQELMILKCVGAGIGQKGDPEKVTSATLQETDNSLSRYDPTLQSLYTLAGSPAPS